MSITEEKLSQILDKKLADLKTDLIATFHKDLLKEVNGLKSIVNNVKTTATNALAKVKSCEQRLKTLEDADPTDVSEFENRLSALENAEPYDLTQVQSSIADNSSVIQSVKDDLESLRSAVDINNRALLIQEEYIEDLRNRQMRSTLVFKGIDESVDEHTWDDTEETLLRTIRTVAEDFPDDAIERCHRGHKKLYGASGSRDIIARFYSWKDAESVKQLFSRKNSKDRSFKTYVSQKYGPLTTARRNLALQTRKELISSGEVAKAYLAYPAKLMVAKNKRDTEFKLHTDFSTCPVKVVPKTNGVQT